MSPAEHAAALRLRADAAPSLSERNYLIWLAQEWERTGDRLDARRYAPEKPPTVAEPPPYRFDARWQGWAEEE